MHPNDTIAALSTPPGRGGIGIVRLSGPAAQAIAAPLLALAQPLEHARARFAHIVDPETGDPEPGEQTGGARTGEKLDEAIVTLFAAPRSYTGEDVIEIAAHGSPVLLDHILRSLLARGARLAEPGEFTQRAWLSGRIDLTQAEAVRDLIDAHTLHQARVAARQLGGSLARAIAPVKQQLLALLATLEAGMDFAAGEDLDDVDVLAPQDITARLTTMRESLSKLAGSYQYGRIVRNGLTLALVGRPNAGKSSLFNRLLQRDRAIVTASPGTTRDLVTEQLALGGIPITLVDTAGLRDSHADEAEAIGIAKSREALAEADLILHVLDAAQPRSAEAEALAQSIAARPHLTILNKIDLLESQQPGAEQPGAPRPSHLGTWVQNESTSQEALQDRVPHSYAQHHRADGWEAAPQNPIPTSALTGQGIDDLREAILSHLKASANTDDALITTLRQQQAIEAALAGLNAALIAVEDKLPHDVLAIDLYTALRGLDTLTGHTTTDDILNLIFSTFCIGK